MTAAYVPRIDHSWVTGNPAAALSVVTWTVKPWKPSKPWKWPA